MELAEATCLKKEGRSNLVTLSLEVNEKINHRLRIFEFLGANNP